MSDKFEVRDRVNGKFGVWNVTKDKWASNQEYKTYKAAEAARKSHQSPLN